MFLLRLPFSLALLIAQSVRLALGQIWANKVRALLTTIGIVIGVASVTAVIAALTGLKTLVLTEFESIGTNKIFIFPTTRKRSEPFWRVRFKSEHFEGLGENCPSVAGFTRVLYSRGDGVSYGTRTEQNVSVLGIDPAWHKIENRSVTLGREFSLIDIERARPVCLINERVRQKLSLPVDCIGQSIVIARLRYMVIGIVEKREDSAILGDGGEGLEVFIPFTTVQRQQPYSSFHVIAASKAPELSEDARAEVTFFLRKKRRIAPGEENNFRVETVEKVLQQFQKIAITITMAATGVVGISLLVGGVGIMNIMLVSVSERTREIGLRKAVGARPGAILLQFLVEAIVLCCMGGLIGVLAGQGLTSIMKNIQGAHLEKAYVPGWAIALSFGFASAVGLVFGFFPAVKAARLDPIEALRHE